ncbi:TonB-dependent receptor [Segetibacter aerophilus]|uniref:TonB-dependent receptor n=1 Tax=Segetibacter aerophilus TaxID=670293 RepID=A0A512BJV5_9BACT|nr:TonB-dependent receptor [Segetibacter aerophilus]GEO12234.1 TonB-dependent receptor [Segetibacter aerophilus]
MKQTLILAAFSILAFNLFAQPPAGMQGGMAGGRQGMTPPSIGHVYGKLVDSVGKAISDASVVILQTKVDNNTKKSKEVLVKGAATKGNGEFNFEELPIMGLKIKITATGFKPFEQVISFQRGGGAGGQRPAGGAGPDMAAMAGGFDKDLGKITLQTEIRKLEDVTVMATGSGRLRMDIDKKVFSVDKNIVTSGGSALDVMKNVPSVNVDIDGNVALRNAPPQVFVDGRPTTLTLEQIPADAIESVEVITNPSAKYDASGGGAGILNIVLKKNKRTGYNGNIRAGIDRLGAMNGGFDFNARQGKVNFFGSINVNQRKSNTVGSVNRINLTDTPRTTINQNNADKSTGRFIFGRAGLDYFITNRTTLSLAGFRVNGQFKPGEIIDITTDSLFNTGKRSSYSERVSTGSRTFNGKGAALGLKQIFAKEGEELTADVNYFSGTNASESFYTTNRTSQGSSLKSTSLQQLLGGGTDYNVIIQSDFVNPISTRTKLETGVRASIRGRENNNSNYFFDNSINAYKLIPSTSNNYTNNDNVYAAYASITSSIKNFGYKLGLRAESSSYKGELTNTGEKFSNSYPVSFFPSIFLSQKLKHDQEIQFSVTRRINRPNFFQLIPFADYTDELNITTGNPNLVPEFTSSLEMSYSKTFNKNHNFLASTYYKKTTDLITRYLQKGVNPFTGREAFINTYINANSSQSYGIELTSQDFFTKWWDVTTNVNIYNSTINATNVKDVSTNSQWSVLGKINSNFKLPADFTAQLSGTYQSKTNLPPGGGGGFGGGPPGARGGGGAGGGPGGGGFGQAQSSAQGYIEPFYGIDLAVKKTFLKSKALSATVSVSDIFRTRSFNQYSESEYFTQFYNRLRDPQMVRLTLNYRFGKIDALLFKRKNNQTGQGATEGIGQ